MVKVILKKERLIFIMLILLQNFVFGQFSCDTLIGNRKYINLNNIEKVENFFKPLNSNINYFQELNDLLTNNNLGFYSYDNYCYYCSQNLNSSHLCDSISNGVINKQSEPDFIKLCVELNKNNVGIFGQDSILCQDCDLFSYYPCKKIEFNLSDIYNLEIEGEQSLNEQIFEPRFITIFIQNNKNEKDEIKIYIPELVKLLCDLKKNEWTIHLHNTLNK